MIDVKRICMGATLALLVALAPGAGEAAWWPWSKKTEKTAPAPAEVAPDAGDRFSRVEAQMRNLTGQVEQLTFQLRQLQDILGRMQGDTEFRLQQLEGGVAKPKKQAAAPLPAPAPVAPSGGILVVPEQPAEAAAAEPVPVARLAAPEASLGQLAVAPPPPAAEGEAPIDLTIIARGTNPAAPLPAAPAAPAIAPKTDVLAALGDPRADYEQAYNSILAGNYDRAENGFRVFLAAHPEDDRASDAQYWLGESLFARGKYREAAVEFLNGHNAYPNGPKAPDTLLKLGLSLAGLGERDAACQTYAKVLKQYPKASKALRQRVAVEQASASC